MMRSRSATVLLVFVAALLAAAIAFQHLTSIAGLVVIGPGYLVQTWLFERHWALGGAGYAATMIGVSALFWTLLIGLVGGAIGWLIRRLGHRRGI
jgi:hypothetical protein